MNLHIASCSSLHAMMRQHAGSGQQSSQLEGRHIYSKAQRGLFRRSNNSNFCRTKNGRQPRGGCRHIVTAVYFPSLLVPKQASKRPWRRRRRPAAAPSTRYWPAAARGRPCPAADGRPLDSQVLKIIMGRAVRPEPAQACRSRGSSSGRYHKRTA